MAKQRIPYFDFLRGAAILMVVAIHTFDGSLAFDSPASCAAIAVRQLLNCAVPVFLAVSGFFLSRKLLVTMGGRIAFWRKQVPRVYVPCLLWSLPLYVLALYGGSRSWLTSTAMLLLCGFSVYYFIALIIQYYLLLPVIQRCCSRRWVAAAAAVSAVSIVAVTCVVTVRGHALPLLVYAGPFPVWLVFFVLGVHLGRSRRDYSPWLPLLAAVVFAAAAYGEAWWLHSLHGAGGYGIKPTAFCYSAAVVLLLFSRRTEEAWGRVAGWLRPVCWLGGLSFGVYLCHCYVIQLADRFCPVSGWFAKWLLVTAVTCLLLAAARAVLPRRLHAWLGLR